MESDNLQKITTNSNQDNIISNLIHFFKKL